MTTFLLVQKYSRDLISKSSIPHSFCHISIQCISHTTNSYLPKKFDLVKQFLHIKSCLKCLELGFPQNKNQLLNLLFKILQDPTPNSVSLLSLSHPMHEIYYFFMILTYIQPYQAFMTLILLSQFYLETIAHFYFSNSYLSFQFYIQDRIYNFPMTVRYESYRH